MYEVFLINLFTSVVARVHAALLLASFECEPPETPEEKERLKQLQEEANLLLQMTNEAHNLALPSFNAGLGCSSHPLLQQMPQPYVLVSTTVDSAVPTIFLERGQTEAQIEASPKQNLQQQNPIFPGPSTSSCGNCEALEAQSSVQSQEDQNNESLPPPPPQLNSPS